MHKAVFKDTLFRDGLQGRGIEAGVLKDALRALTAIDALGIEYHELGFAVGNVEATERIKAALELPLRGYICAFGRTAMADVEAILSLGVPVGVLVAKSRRSDTGNVIRVDAKANLELIEQTVSALASQGVRVIFDAEHFFQGFHECDQAYALEVLGCAREAGARWIVLCDTNGKMAPHHITEAVRAALEVVPGNQLGIHTHNDRGRAIANAEAAFHAGVTLIEGVTGGFGGGKGEKPGPWGGPRLFGDFRGPGREKSIAREDANRRRYEGLPGPDFLDASKLSHIMTHDSLSDES